MALTLGSNTYEKTESVDGWIEDVKESITELHRMLESIPVGNLTSIDGKVKKLKTLGSDAVTYSWLSGSKFPIVITFQEEGKDVLSISFEENEEKKIIMSESHNDTETKVSELWKKWLLSSKSDRDNNLYFAEDQLLRAQELLETHINLPLGWMADSPLYNEIPRAPEEKGPWVIKYNTPDDPADHDRYAVKHQKTANTINKETKETSHFLDKINMKFNALFYDYSRSKRSSLEEVNKGTQWAHYFTSKIDDFDYLVRIDVKWNNKNIHIVWYNPLTKKAWWRKIITQHKITKNSLRNLAKRWYYSDDNRYMKDLEDTEQGNHINNILKWHKENYR